MVTLLVILAFLLMFGAILYMALHKLLKIWQDEKVKPRTRALWMWRTMLVIVLLFLVALIFINQNIFFLIIQAGTSQADALLILVFVLFVSLLEITIIDLLLPDMVSIWKRMLVETLSLITLICTTSLIFLLFILAP